MRLSVRLAWEGIRKNKQLYLPYICACVGMVALYYVMAALCDSALLYEMRGGNSSRIILGLGSWVIAVFAAIFLFYTHSFLLRRRQREFGLYHVLGLGKLHLAAVCLLETLLTAVLALLGGGVLGAALLFAAERGMHAAIGGDVQYTFSLHGGVLAQTAVIFLVIFLLTRLSAWVKVGQGTAVSLLPSENYGEKPPRGSIWLALLGAGMLAAAYVMAVSIQEPLQALQLFFLAVILVILATYLLFITGSVALCRRLQRNRDYYYQPRHFVSVSSMTYRMKRNGAGLASICVLITMVLVMLSSSACLYFGAEESLTATYPDEFDLAVWVEDAERLPALEQALNKAGAPYGIDLWQQGETEENGAVWHAVFNTGLSREQQLALGGAIREALIDPAGGWSYSASFRAEAADDFCGTYGGLFALGIVLSVLFIAAAVLIIYYKQLCEGYEDQPRFAIMQKVGMTAADIRSSVNSQLLTVFFLPLCGAALHMAFAFPMVRRMLLLFQLTNVKLFAITALISLAVVALVYTMVYKATSNAYYRIVRGSL